MDPNQPQSQPQWTPPPQQPMGWGGPGYGTAPQRPGGVTFAAIFLIVMGVFTTLAAIVLFIGGAAFSGVFGNAFAGLIVVIGIVVLVVAILHFAAGIGSLQGKGWARWTGAILAIVFAILLILSGISGFTARPTADNPNPIVGAVISIVIAVLYALAAWALIKASAYFAARR